MTLLAYERELTRELHAPLFFVSLCAFFWRAPSSGSWARSHLISLPAATDPRDPPLGRPCAGVWYLSHLRAQRPVSGRGGCRVFGFCLPPCTRARSWARCFMSRVSALFDLAPEDRGGGTCARRKPHTHEKFGVQGKITVLIRKTIRLGALLGEILTKTFLNFGGYKKIVFRTKMD